MHDIMKIVKSHQESGFFLLFFLTRSVSKTIKYESKEQSGGFLGMLCYA